MSDSISITGTIKVELWGPDGRLKDFRKVQNIVTNTGRQAIIDRLQGNTPPVSDYVAIGTGATAAATTDVALQTEVARSQGTLSQPDAHTDRCVFTFAAGTGTGTITEAGRLNAAAAGTLMGRQTFTGVVKTASDSLQITYDFTYAAA
jgi:hypothetical protein